jgi:hypothetical protein
MHSCVRVFLIGIAVVSAVACGPVTSQHTRWDWKPYNREESRQSKDGLVVEQQLVTTAPAGLSVKLQSCGRDGKLELDELNRPMLEDVSLMTREQLWFKVSVTNDTEHILRLSRAVIRLFDPAGEQHAPVDKASLAAAFASGRECSSSQRAMSQFNLVKLLDRDTELLPGSSVNGYMVFSPPSKQMAGVWKLAFYEMPVKTDEAGNVARTTRFELRTKVTKYVDTYEAENTFATPVLKSTVESNE